MKNSIKIILLLMFFIISFDGFSQDKIEKSKNELKKNSKSTDRHSRNHSRNSSGSLGGDDSFGNLIVRGIAEGFMFITYYTAIGNYGGEDHLHSNLTNYPYYNGISGNYENADSVSIKIKFLRFDLEDKLLYCNENLFGNHLKFKIRPFQYFYLQTDFIQLSEFNRIRRDYSNLSLFAFNLCYDRIRFERINFGWTLGLNYLGNDVQKTGFSYGLNGDLFIAKNFSLYSSMKWCSINDEHVNVFEVQWKYHLRKCFITLGYEHLKIGSPNYDFISAGGGIYL